MRKFIILLALIPSVAFAATKPEKHAVPKFPIAAPVVAAGQPPNPTKFTYTLTVNTKMASWLETHLPQAEDLGGPEIFGALNQINAQFLAQMKGKK